MGELRRKFMKVMKIYSRQIEISSTVLSSAAERWCSDSKGLFRYTIGDREEQGINWTVVWNKEQSTFEIRERRLLRTR